MYLDFCLIFVKPPFLRASAELVFCLLAVVCVSAVFSVVMFVLQLLRRRLVVRIDHLTPGSHLGHLLKNDCVVHGLVGVFSPGKGAVILAEYRRHCFVIFLADLKLIGDQDAVFFS